MRLLKVIKKKALMGKSTNQSGWTIRSPGPAIGPGARGAWEKGGSLAPGLTLC